VQRDTGQHDRGHTLEPSEQVADGVRLAGARSDGARLQHLRSVLPYRVRVTASTHPLFGQLLEASAFRRWRGVLLLVVGLLDGSPGTIRADATDVFATDRWCRRVWWSTVPVFSSCATWSLRCSADRVLDVRANRFGLSLVRANDLGKVNLFARPESSCRSDPTRAARPGAGACG
jgi:hypothetical protein